jgi:hypothetical protein
MASRAKKFATRGEQRYGWGVLRVNQSTGVRVELALVQTEQVCLLEVF